MANPIDFDSARKELARKRQEKQKRVEELVLVLTRRHDTLPGPLAAEDLPLFVQAMNRIFSVVRDGGKIRIAWNTGSMPVKEFIETELPSIKYRRIKADGSEGAEISAVRYWFESPERTPIKEYDFWDTKEGERPGYINMFTRPEFPLDSGRGCASYLKFWRDIICRGDPDAFARDTRLQAYKLQNPALPIPKTIAYIGATGCGKTFHARTLMRMHGTDPARNTPGTAVMLSSMRRLSAQFNTSLMYRTCVVLDDAGYMTKDHRSAIIEVATGDTIEVEQKWRDAKTLPNYAILLITANGTDWLPDGDEAILRRLLILEVGDDRQRDAEYFKGLAEKMAAGGDRALFNYLMTINLDGFNPNADTESAGSKEVRTDNLPPQAAWLYNLVENGYPYFPAEGWINRRGQLLIRPADLLRSLQRHYRDTKAPYGTNVSYAKGTDLTRWLSKNGDPKQSIAQYKDAKGEDKTARKYIVFPPRKEMAEMLRERLRIVVPDPSDTEQWDLDRA